MKRNIFIAGEDETLKWYPIADAGIKVYTYPLILNSVLRQEMDWEGVVEPVELKKP
jgi:hypothetical protein